MAPRLVFLCNLELPEKDDGKLPPSFFSSPVGLYRDNYTAKKKAAVFTNGEGNVGIELDGENALKSGKINNKARAPKAYLTDQELFDWFDNWAVRLDADPEETTKLIGDLHAFAEMRKAKKKPILTVNAAGRHAKKLLDYSADFPEYRLAAMRYVLSQSVESNWEKLYPITKPDDFNRWLHDNYGVQVGHAEPEVEYFE